MLERPPRRRVLGAGLAGGTALAALLLGGCRGPARTPTPSVSASGGPSGQGPSGTASPPLVGTVAAAHTEAALAASATAILVDRRAHTLDPDQRAALAAAAAGHTRHVRALLGADPTARPTTEPTAAGPTAAPSLPPAKPSATALPAAVRALARAEAAAAAGHGRRADPSTGLVALLWASLSVAAAEYAAAVSSGSHRPAPGIVSSQPAAVLTDVAAMQQLTGQLHAMLYGYDVALGQLSGPDKQTALARDAACRVLRDTLTARLLAARAAVPPAAPAYRLPVPVTDAASARSLLARIETALQPFCGQWVAAADAAVVPAARSALAAANAAGVGWGAALTPWPGWPT